MVERREVVIWVNSGEVGEGEDRRFRIDVEVGVAPTERTSGWETDGERVWICLAVVRREENSSCKRVRAVSGEEPEYECPACA